MASSSSSTVPTGITAANVASLSRHQVKLDGTVDASAIYLHGVTVKGSTDDVFFVTTTYGKTIAVDANKGAVLWEYTPPKYDSWVGTRQITNSTPVADPDRQHIYAAAPDGTVQKLAVSDGHVLWTTPITLLPLREKIASPLKEFRGHIVAVTGGYIGDRPPTRATSRFSTPRPASCCMCGTRSAATALACSIPDPAEIPNLRSGDAPGR